MSTSFLPSPVGLLDTDVLDCPICVNALTPPVFQCKRGHLLCSSCTKRMSNCPTCKLPIVGRCNAVEKILESTQARCPNWKSGCTVTTTYGQQLEEHKNSCLFTPCSCPFEGCNFLAISDLLNQHVSAKHSNSVHGFNINIPTFIVLAKGTNRVVLQERGGTLFVLNRLHEQPLESNFSLVCLAPPSSGARYTYKIAGRAYKNRELTTDVFVAPNCSTQPPPQNCSPVNASVLEDKQMYLDLFIRSLN